MTDLSNELDSHPRSKNVPQPVATLWERVYRENDGPRLHQSVFAETSARSPVGRHVSENMTKARRTRRRNLPHSISAGGRFPLLSGTWRDSLARCVIQTLPTRSK